MTNFDDVDQFFCFIQCLTKCYFVILVFYTIIMLLKKIIFFKVKLN